MTATPRIDAMAFRVPVEDGSVVDATVTLKNPARIRAVHGAMQAAADGRMKGVLRVTEEALVSRNIIGDPHSSIIDAQSTMALGDNTVKVVSLYDNEWATRPGSSTWPH